MANHTEEWLQQSAWVSHMPFAEPLEPALALSCQWLLAVYSQEIFTGLEDMKDSTYGTMLKMASTKKV